MIGEDGLSNHIGYLIVKIAVIFIEIGFVQVDHEELVGALGQQQNEEIIGVRDVCITNVYPLSSLGELNSLDVSAVKHIEKEQVVAKARARHIGPTRGEAAQ
jgi:hypothetical protein